jgi:PAS domain S-box-containing protein
MTETALQTISDRRRIDVNDKPIENQPIENQLIKMDSSDRKAAEAELRQSQQQLQLALRAAQMGFWSWDMATNTIHWPAETETMFGLEPGSFGGTLEAFLDQLHPDDWERTSLAVERALAGDDKYQVEYRSIFPDGTIHWFEAHGDVLRDEQGNPTSMIGVAREISDRKQAQKEQARLLAILEATSDFVGTVDPSGQVLYINQSGRQMLGLTPEEAIAHRSLRQSHPDWVNQLILTQGLPEAMRSGSWLGETAILGKNGQEIPVSQLILSHRSETGEIEYFSTIARDISEQQAVLRDRERQENALRFIVEGTVSKTGNEFFRACVQHLAELFQVQYAFITELADDTFSQSRMLALWTGERFTDPYEFYLTGTPCNIVFQESCAIFPDALQSRFPDADMLATLGAESYLGVVIVDSQGKAIGNLGIIDTKPLADDLNAAKSILQLFAARVGAEMERNAAEAVLSEYADRQTLLNQLVHQIRNSLDLDAVIATTIQAIRNVLNIDNCSFAWYSPDAEPPTWDVIQEAILDGIPSSLGCYPASLVGPIEPFILKQEILRIDDAEQYTEPMHREFLQTIHCQSEILLPIHTHSDKIGIIICSHHTQVRPWTDGEIELLKSVSAQLAIAIDQAELYAESRDKSQALQKTLQELQRTQAQMVQSEKMSSLGQLVAGIAHEINNPVNFIHGNLTHAGEYSHDLLELMILQNRLKAKPEYPGIRVIKNYGDLPEVECFAGQLNQVFMNILANAIDALEERDRTRLPDEQKQVPSTIYITTEITTDRWVSIRIHDNGSGIPEPIQERIFDPFFTTKPIGKGTGMGMSISYQIVVEKHNGSLECVSTPETGTEFAIRIPIQQSPTRSISL